MTLHRVNGLTPRGALATSLPKGWRICSPDAVSDDIHGSFALVQSDTTAVVCGLNERGFISMAEQDLGAFLDEAATIKLARVQHGLSQDQLAALLQVNTMTVSGWETGTRRATAKRRKGLEAILGIKLGKY